MIKVLISGSFDPVTVGHEDLVRRCAALFDDVTVCIFSNTEKQYMFSEAQRLSFLSAMAEPYANVRVDASKETVSDYAKKHGITLIVKGARNGTDFDSEYAQSRVNLRLSGIETLLIPSSPEYSHISSTVLRNLIGYEKPYGDLLPRRAVPLVEQAYKENKEKK